MRQYIIQTFTLLLLLSPLLSQAQKKQEPNRNALSFGILAHTNGFGVEVQQWLMPEDKLDFVIGLSFSSFRNPKELKIESAYRDQGGKDYIFDKKNFAYLLAPTFGVSKVLMPQNEFNRIGLRASVNLGPTLALMKPYYIEVAVPIPNNPTQAYVEVDKYDAAQYNYSNIVGEADFFLGLNEITAVPGLRAKVSTTVDFSASQDYIRGLEVSFLTDIFFRKLEILDNTPNQNIYLGGSVSFLIGNAW